MRYPAYAIWHGCFYIKKYCMSVCKSLQLTSWGSNEWIEKPKTCEVNRHTHNLHPALLTRTSYPNHPELLPLKHPLCTSWKFPPTTDLPWDFTTPNTSPRFGRLEVVICLASNGLGFAAGLLPNNPKRLLLPAAACKKKMCHIILVKENIYLLWKVLQPWNPLSFCEKSYNLRNFSVFLL